MSKWTFVVMFIFYIGNNQINSIIFLCYQAKRNQALLESNLPGIHLMVDENVNSMGYHYDSPLIFLETTMP